LLILLLQLKVYEGSYIDATFHENGGHNYLNIEVNLVGVETTEGLCGSPDTNVTNDYKFRHNQTVVRVNNTGTIPDDLAESWRYVVCD
jgi:hypothetical protein